MSTDILYGIISPLVFLLIGIMLRISNYSGWGRKVGLIIIIIGLAAIGLKIGDYLLTHG